MTEPSTRVAPDGPPADDTSREPGGQPAPADNPQHVAYWRDQLRGAPPRIELPYDRPATDPATVTVRWAAELAPDIARRMSVLARTERVSTLMVAVAAMAAWAARLSGQDEIIINSPLAAAQAPSDLPATLVAPIRVDCGGDPTFVDLLRRSREVVLDALAHRKISAGALAGVTPAPPARQLALSIPPVDADVQPRPPSADLHLCLTDDLGHGVLHYPAEMFDQSTARRLFEQIILLLTSASIEPGARISQLPMLTESDRRLLAEQRGHVSPVPEASVAQIFEAVARTWPDVTAVRARHDAVSYRELDQRANQLAHHLRERGAGPETVVGVCVERGVDLPLSFLAVLKAGAVYLPLDARHPAERLRAILDSAGASIVVSAGAAADAVSTSTADVVLLDRDANIIAGAPETVPDSNVSPANLAYVIYTSGSTGTPKGVEVTHRGLCNLASALRETFHVGPGDRVSLFSSATFDASIWEMAMALLNGATLGVLTTAEATPADIAAEIRELDLTIGTYPPTMLRAVTPAALGTPRLLISAGERCDAELVNTWAVGRRFVNAYGPTETTVCATFADCSAPATAPPPIGRPMPNLMVYVLNEDLQPVPVGAPGEIFVAGVGLARGYRASPTLTAQSFLPDPYGVPGSRMYRTGDLGRLGNDGNLHYLGRLDHQVKLRGFRIELGEIEHQLTSHAMVRDAVVMVRPLNGDDRLVAYVTASDLASTDEQLRTSLRATLARVLPDYMLPASYVVLDAMPLTTSGKIDRDRLPEPGGAAGSAPAGNWQNSDERRIAMIWSETLGVDQVHRTDSFFELGGHSLVAAQMIGSVRQAYQLTRLPMRLLFERPVLADFAEAVVDLRAA